LVNTDLRNNFPDNLSLWSCLY